MGLTIVGGALLIVGLLIVVVSEAQRLKSPHTEPGISRVGEVLAVCGLSIGIALLVAMTVGRAGRGRASRDRVVREPSDGGGRVRRERAGGGRARRERAARRRARRLQADPGRRAKGRRAAAPTTGPRPDPAFGWLSPPHGLLHGRPHRPADGRSPQPAGGWPQDAADEWSSPPQNSAEEWLSPPQNSAEEWLSPLRTAGPGVVPRRAMPAWPESVEEDRAGSDGYADDGWHPDLDNAWDPGPAYVWNPRGEDGSTGGDRDWRPGGEADRNPGPSRPSADPGPPGRTDLEVDQGHQDPPAPAYLTGPHPERDSGEDVSSGSAQEKLDQIKDLYLTAEAIGEDALIRHFDQLSQRQRALIREYFERAGLGSAQAQLGGESAENGASLPG